MENLHINQNDRTTVLKTQNTFVQVDLKILLSLLATAIYQHCSFLIIENQYQLLDF